MNIGVRLNVLLEQVGLALFYLYIWMDSNIYLYLDEFSNDYLELKISVFQKIKRIHNHLKQTSCKQRKEIITPTGVKKWKNQTLNDICILLSNFITILWKNQWLKGK